MTIPTGIEGLEQARRYAADANCGGCGKPGTLSAYEVQKEGPNQGRLFAKCRHCGYFGWLSAATAADPELDRVRAAATPCPKCGKGRQANRVGKEGANQGRLFLTCADPACGRFEWASPATGPAPGPPARPAPNAAPRDEDGFLAAIRDNPDDDTTRLVYADWLDETGQPARAELIRIQVEQDRLAPQDPDRDPLDEQARAILAEHEATWAEPVRPLALRWKFVRGLLDEIEVEADRFAATAEELLRVAPSAAIHVHVAGWEGVRTLVACKRLRQLRRLALLGGRMGGVGARILAESPNIADLRALGLPGQSLGQPGCQALAGSRYLTRLEVLDLSENNLTRSAIPYLASSANLPRLRRLVLANNLLQDSDARALANSPHLQELRERDLSGNGITREGFEAINRSPLGARLKRLTRSAPRHNPPGRYR
ncbi:MAG TPA: TIGR02996 domain-containing protein [Urbifossiella sp.]|jgi:uncharacterized protein (TIGR02996 family)|nr:TIGR02996 domain-containing protein [Urbifossiella sp.]